MRWLIWRMEWKIALRRRRLFVLNMGIPLLLVGPLVLARAPVFHASAAVAVLFVLFGTFGSAIPLLREGEEGILRRLLLTGVPEGRLLAERVLAHAVLDLAQLTPSLVLLLWGWGAEGPIWLQSVPILALTLVAANLAGVWVAALARSVAEGALFAALTALFLLHGSGVFRRAPPDTVGALLESILPFGPLHSVILAAGGGEPPGLVWSLSAPGIGALLLLAFTLALARPIVERVAPPGSS